MEKLFSGLLGGIYGYVATFVIGLSVAAGATYYVVHNANAVEIASLKLVAKTTEAANVTHSLAQLQGFIANIQTAQTDYQGTLEHINANIVAARNGWKAATMQPLPKGCLPDPARLRAVNAAISRANNSAPAP